MTEGPPLLGHGQRIRHHKLFLRKAARAYLYLACGMGLIATALPLLLLLTGSEPNSISAYYWHARTARDLLVGALVALGLFLFLFQGLQERENWLLNVAGAAVIVVALVPVDEAASDAVSRRELVHVAAALLFFICLALVAIVFAKVRIEHLRDERLKTRFRLLYNVAGALMIVLPGTVAVLWLLQGRQAGAWIFWGEALAVWAFAFYWFVKTAEYRLLLGIPFGPTRREAEEVAALQDEQG